MRYDFPDCTQFTITKSTSGYDICINNKQYKSANNFPIISKEDANPTTYAAIINVLYDLFVSFIPATITTPKPNLLATLDLPDINPKAIFTVYKSCFLEVRLNGKTVCASSPNSFLLSKYLYPSEISAIANIVRELL